MTEHLSTAEVLGIDFHLYKKWFEHQFTPDMNWSNFEFDRVEPNCLFDVSKDEELRECFNWKNTQISLEEIHKQKGIKYKFLDYQLHFIRAYQFLKLKEKGLNEKLH